MISLLLSQIDFIAILPFAVFGAIAVGAWAISETLFNRTSKSEERLMLIKQRAGDGKTGDDGKDVNRTTDGITRLLAKASPALGDVLKPTKPNEVGKQKQKLDEAGFRGEQAPLMFNTLKMVMAIIGFVLAGGGALLLNGMNISSLTYTLIFTGVFLFLPELVLSLIAKSRKQKVFLGLPDALDLMVVCVEAGLGLDQAMRKVAVELFSAHPVIASEFNICNQHLQMGKQREQVLRELGDRNGVDDLKTLSSIMIQVDKFGTSIGTALRTQSDAMRVRRRQIAEEKAAKTAVKLIFPLVIFIFPGIFVVLVGPAAITMVNEMLPALQK
ncbi:MAG: type II secretion system F family protein [Mariniblastus sp.]|nr:type II secretion system F family protein [Mariniblastus sp.]